MKRREEKRREEERREEKRREEKRREEKRGAWKQLSSSQKSSKRERKDLQPSLTQKLSSQMFVHGFHYRESSHNGSHLSQQRFHKGNVLRSI